MFAAHFAGVLLPLFALAFLLNAGGAFAYYAQHFYLPSSEFADTFGKRIGAQSMPIGANEWAAQPKMAMEREEEEEGTEEGQQQEGAEVMAESGEGKAKGEPMARGNPTKAPVIPRRTLRHLFNDFGSDQMGRQYKRMKPCFYSPIQCLMKRSSA
ncbi:hypothetical protein niasHT_015355 [Heterodera trifolii]|uniref:Uncharacterized protein n=1 Tax=Heterodera trifolii TaxID=157864 RepID=A0ABD2KZV2_9BILA